MNFKEKKVLPSKYQEATSVDLENGDPASPGLLSGRSRRLEVNHWAISGNGKKNAKNNKQVESPSVNTKGDLAMQYHSELHCMKLLLDVWRLSGQTCHFCWIEKHYKIYVSLKIHKCSTYRPNRYFLIENTL